MALKEARENKKGTSDASRRRLALLSIEAGTRTQQKRKGTGRSLLGVEFMTELL